MKEARTTPAYLPSEVHFPDCAVSRLRQEIPTPGLETVNAQLQQERSTKLDNLPFMLQPHPDLNGEPRTYGLET